MSSPLRILLMPVGSAGDVHPFVGIGGELKRRGHDVTIATNEHFKTLIESVGLKFIMLGTDEQFRSVIANPDLWSPGLKASRMVFGMATRQLEEQYDLAAHGGWNVVAAGPLALGARIAHDATGVPLATVQLAPSVFLSCQRPPKLPGLIMPDWFPLPVKRGIYRIADAIIDGIAARPVNQFRAQLGLPPIKRIVSQWWNSPQRIICMFPDWFGMPADDWPKQARLTGFGLYDERDATTLPQQLGAFLDGGSPPIAFTPGSANVHGERFFADSVKACETLEKRAILLTRHAQQIPTNLPTSAIHCDYAPFSALLPRCAALVHHGGVGTTAQALAAGIPQLVMPLSHDQFDNAHHVCRLGVGEVLPGKRYNAGRAAAKLGSIINDHATIARCRDIASRITLGEGVALAADEVEKCAEIRSPKSE